MFIVQLCEFYYLAPLITSYVYFAGYLKAVIEGDEDAAKQFAAKNAAKGAYYHGTFVMCLFSS